MLNVAACRSKPSKRATADELGQASYGVDDTHIRIGQFAVFSGASAGLGTELWRGEQAYFIEVNQNGGIYDRRIELSLRDDAYDPERAANAIRDLADNENVFTLFGAVGTPTLFAALPELEKRRSTGLILVSNYTGAQKQREAPYLDLVFNVRAGYNQETRELVDNLVRLGCRHIGVFIQNDSYGEAGLAGIRAAVRALNDADASLKLSEPVVTKYARGQKFEVSNNAQVEDLKSNHVDAIIGVGAYQACAGFTRDARNAGLNVPIANVSFVGADALLRLLNQYEHDSGNKVTSNLYNSQVVPNWDATDINVVAEYRALADKHPPTLPGEIQDALYRTLPYTFTGLEGFINAKVLVEALRRAGHDLTRQNFATALQSIRDWDAGLGAHVTFGPDDNQGLDRVWLTAVKDGSWIQVTDMKSTFDRNSIVGGNAKAKAAAPSSAPLKR